MMPSTVTIQQTSRRCAVARVVSSVAGAVIFAVVPIASGTALGSPIGSVESHQTTLDSDPGPHFKGQVPDGSGDKWRTIPPRQSGDVLIGGDPGCMVCVI